MSDQNRSEQEPQPENYGEPLPYPEDELMVRDSYFEFTQKNPNLSNQFKKAIITFFRLAFVRMQDEARIKRRLTGN